MKKIGDIAGFCDICRKSMLGYKRYYIGEYNQLSGHESCLDEFLETEEGQNWIEEDKQKKEEAEELERKEKEAAAEKKRQRQEEAAEKERQEQEKLKKLIKLKLIFNPFDRKNPLFGYMNNNFEYYSEEIDENGEKYWFIYVEKDVADKLIAEQNRLKEESRKKAKIEENKIKMKENIERLKWASYIIGGLVFAIYIFVTFDFNFPILGKIVFFLFLITVPFLAIRVIKYIFSYITDNIF